ncbi:MAG TPA: ABC transporter permease [Pyrinomonadaceae bacterium]|jgi:ABC-type dipeptide/oligopeptide/nickel transport system permease component
MLFPQKRMLRLILRKLLQGLLMLFVVSGLTFALLAAAGGDALTALRDNPQISEATIEQLRTVYGLDKPVTSRYASWIADAVRGDLGESMAFRIPVVAIVWSRFLNTLLMGLIALVMSIAASIFLAVWSTRARNKWLDRLVELLIFLTASTPRMVLALLALLLSLRMVSGASSYAFQLIAGAVVLAVPLISIMLAQLKNGLDEVMSEDFIRTARAKGLSEWAVISKHALRPSLSPFLTIAGLSLGGLLGGSVIVETVLGWQGIGALMVSAVRGRDVPVVMGVVLVASAAVWFGNALAELLQFANDARIRTGER